MTTGRTLDKEFEIPDYSPVCTWCRHLELGSRSCAAFREIPLPIWKGENDHKSPYPGDGGIQFERVGNVPAQVVPPAH
jgi:hypothetical protein